MTGFAGRLLAIGLLLCFSSAHAVAAGKTFNTQEFTGLAISYDNAVLDYDLDSPSGTTVHFTSCKQVDATREEEIAAFDYPLLQFLSMNCLALRRYSDSRLPDRSFFPARLTKAFIASLPATAAVIVNDEDMSQRRGKSLAAYAKKLHISMLPDGEARVVTDIDDSLYVVMARADFDGDGMEDILVRIQWNARDAFGKATDLILLSKKSASSPVVVSWRAPAK